MESPTPRSVMSFVIINVAGSNDDGGDAMMEAFY